MSTLVEQPLNGKLTKRQAAILDFLSTYTAEFGYPPTVREIGDGFGIRSPNGVICHLQALAKKGFISRGGNVSRGIKVMDKGASERKQLVNRLSRLRTERLRELCIQEKV